MAYATTAEFQELLTHLNDVAKSYNPSPDLDGFHSRIQIIDTAKKIIRGLTAPADMGFNHVINMTELVAIRTLLKLKVLENIPVDGSISLEDLAKATGAQPSLLDRLLRLVVGTGFVDQTRIDGGDYVHTKFSEAYTTTPGPGKFFQAIYDECHKSMVHFDEYLGKDGSITEPDDISRNPYCWRHGQEGTNGWAVMAQFPDRMKVFQIGLAGTEESVPIVGFYDFAQLRTDEPDRVELVDVGGGQGQSLKMILDATPELSPAKMVLQDMAGVVEMAKASRIVPDAVVMMPHDFYTEQPVKGARAYYIRRCLHNYSDAVCVKILTQLAQAMAPDSRVLIADMVVPARVGEADLSAAMMDNIMFIIGGKERTEAAFADIIDQAGLRVVKVWRAKAGAGALVEAELK